MSYTVHCQRCDRPAVQRKIEKTTPALLFATVTKRPVSDVRLCASCIEIIENLGQSISKAKKRGAKR